METQEQKELDKKEKSFYEYVNSPRKQTKSVTFETNPNYQKEKSFLYLDKDDKITKYEEKQAEYEKILENYRRAHSTEAIKEKFEHVKSKIHDNRNENIENLIKDVKNKSNLEIIQSKLKNEFDLFLNDSVNNSQQKIKDLSISIFDKTNSNSNAQKNLNLKLDLSEKWNFLTQDPSENLNEINEEKTNDKSARKNNESNNKSRLSNRPSSKTKSLSKSTKDKQIQNFNPNNMQIALIEDVNEETSKNSSAIKLKKMLDHIKRVDLPKFQPELHQICQYGGDAELLKLYPENIHYEINDKPNGLGRYCIHEACIKGNIVMLKGLLAYVDDINKVDQHKQTAAHIATKYGELECLKVLIANSINLELVDEHGMNVSHIAARFNHPKIIEYLFNLGYRLDEPSNDGKLPVHYAAEYGSHEALVLLSQYYVDLSYKDNDGNTPAHLAAKNDKLNCLMFLIQYGLPIDKLLNNLGRNVAHVCCINGSIRCLHWLLENNKNLDTLDSVGNSLVHLCCLNAHGECLNCCIQHDVDLNRLNNDGHDIMDIAKKVGKTIYVEKALSNHIKCQYCVKKAIKLKWLKEHEKTLGEKAIKKTEFKVHQSKQQSQNRNYSAESNLKGDFIAQYFGPDV